MFQFCELGKTFFDNRGIRWYRSIQTILIHMSIRFQTSAGMEPTQYSYSENFTVKNGCVQGKVWLLPSVFTILCRRRSEWWIRGHFRGIYGYSDDNWLLAPSLIFKRCLQLVKNMPSLTISSSQLMLTPRSAKRSAWHSWQNPGSWTMCTCVATLSPGWTASSTWAIGRRPNWKMTNGR